MNVNFAFCFSRNIPHTAIRIHSFQIHIYLYCYNFKYIDGPINHIYILYNLNNIHIYLFLKNIFNSYRIHYHIRSSLNNHLLCMDLYINIHFLYNYHLYNCNLHLYLIMKFCLNIPSLENSLHKQ